MAPQWRRRIGAAGESSEQFVRDVFVDHCHGVVEGGGGTVADGGGSRLITIKGSCLRSEEDLKQDR